MKSINEEVVTTRKQEIAEAARLRQRSVVEECRQYNEERIRAARPKIIELLARDDILGAISLALEVGIEDEVDDQYLKMYADEVVERGCFSSATYDVAANIYTKLRLPECAAKAIELRKRAKHFESTDGVFEAMTR